VPRAENGIVEIDTLLGGFAGLTASYLVTGPSPALVETGAQTSVPALTAALAEAGLAADDLAWLVLTHVHLDHCGGAGDIAQAFPRARVVVHPRGARHLVGPGRLVEATRAVFGDLEILGGLTAVEEDRITTAEDGFRVQVGPGRDLVLLHAPGHARHHLVVLDEATGVLMAGDALGVRLPGTGLYPAVPPPEFDRDAALATLDRLAALRPQRVLLGHFGDAGPPQDAIAGARRLQALMAGAAERAWRRFGTVEAVDHAVNALVPAESHVADPEALARWRDLRWIDNNPVGLARWAEGRAKNGL
jgi:glyoxylase-like metal-dependent hydrolase (beta-lactamase superfamily II)